MDSLSDINRRQSEILIEMASIDSMRIGTVSPNTKVRSTKDGGSVSSTYYVLSYKDANQKTISESVRSDRVEEYQRLVDNTKVFRNLVKEYEALADNKAKILLSGKEDSKKNE